jgi:hypothetical protein
MDKKLICHITSEIIVLSCISIYFYKKNKNLETQINELKKEFQILQIEFIKLQQTIKLITSPNIHIKSTPQIFNPFIHPENQTSEPIISSQIYKINNTTQPNKPPISQPPTNPLFGNLMNMMPMFTGILMGTTKENNPPPVIISDENESEDDLIESTVNELLSDVDTNEPDIQIVEDNVTDSTNSVDNKKEECDENEVCKINF